MNTSIMSIKDMNQTGEVLSEAEDQVILELDSEAGEDTSSINEHGHVNAGVTHAHGQHSHTHSPEAKKKQLNRLARAIGHLRSIQGMIERDEDCADVIVQLSAVRSAINNLGKVIIDEHLTHCIYHAIEEGDETSVREFQEAIRKFL